MSVQACSVTSTNSRTSRRNILKLGGTIAFSSALPAGQFPWVHAGEDNAIRLALIGCGGRGRGAVGDAFSVASGPIQLHALADLTEDRVAMSRKVLQNHLGDRATVPEDRCFVGLDAYRHAIDSLRPGDIAMLTAYAFCRPQQIEYAVSKGVHVFMEKTFAPDPAGCHRILAAGEAAKEANLKIAAGLQCRHSVARQALIDKIRAGELGEIQKVRATRVCGGGFLAFPPDDVDHVLWQIRNRMHFLWASAGILLEMLIHQIDECCWIMDRWPESATGKGNRSDRPNNCSQNFEHYDIEYSFACGGKASVESVQPFATFIHGSKRAAQFSGDVHRATVHTYQGHEMDNAQIDWAAEREPRGPWQAQWKNFLEAICEDRPFNEIDRAIKANLASIMGRAAAHMGRTVTWQEVVDSRFAFAPQVDDLEIGGPAPVQPDAEGNYPFPVPGQWVEV
jgi:predicted dehydrogenase